MKRIFIASLGILSVLIMPSKAISQPFSLLKDINTNPSANAGNSDPSYFINFNGTLYFFIRPNSRRILIGLRPVIWRPFLFYFGTKHLDASFSRQDPAGHPNLGGQHFPRPPFSSAHFGVKSSSPRKLPIKQSNISPKKSESSL